MSEKKTILFKYHCESCESTSYIGIEYKTPLANVLGLPKYGLSGALEHHVDPALTGGEFIHCPACDSSADADRSNCEIRVLQVDGCDSQSDDLIAGELI